MGPGDVVAGRYRLEAVVGAGPLGWVFRAQDGETGATLALKLIRPHLVQTAQEREHFARTLRRGREVAHPGVVHATDAGEDASRAPLTLTYLTQPLLEGVSLRRIIDVRLARGQRFSLQEVELLLAQLAGALDAAHRLGPHTDVKPENVLVQPDALKLTDFGMGDAIPRQPFLQAQRQVRADRFLAPELHEGEADARADVYSLGALLGEMLCGQLPDGGVPELSRLNPGLPRALDGLYRCAVDRNPLVRPPSAGALLSELSALVRASSVAPRAAPPRAAFDDEEPTLADPPTEDLGTLDTKPPPPVPDEVPPRGPSSRETVVVPTTAELPVPTGLLDGPQERRCRTEVLMPPASVRPQRRLPVLRVPGGAPAALALAGRRPAMWIALLAVVGMAAGAGAGLWLLQRLPSTPSIIPLPPGVAPGTGGGHAARRRPPGGGPEGVPGPACESPLREGHRGPARAPRALPRPADARAGAAGGLSGVTGDAAPSPCPSPRGRGEGGLT